PPVAADSELAFDPASSAVLRHGEAQNVIDALASALVMSRADSVLALSSSLFQTPLIDLWMPLLSGARLVIAAAGLELDGARLSSLIRSEGITFMHARP